MTMVYGPLIHYVSRTNTSHPAPHMFVHTFLPTPPRECGYEVVEMNASDCRNKSDAKVGATAERGGGAGDE